MLAEDGLKAIIISSLQFLVEDNRIKLYAFVIMLDHIHLIWQIQDKYEGAKVQQSFLKYTAQQMKFQLMKTNPKKLKIYNRNASDRGYQFWERKSLSIDLRSREVFLQTCRHK